MLNAVRAAQPRLYVAATYVLFSATLAFASIAITGFLFGVSNNVFHIPYVLRLSESQEFAGDAFYSSLEHFSSIIWPPLRFISNQSNIELVFYIANFLSRATAFAGLLFLLRSGELRTLTAMSICTATIALTPWFQGLSIVGGHGMFLKYFTHSETTWGLVFLSLALFSLQRPVLASALVGVVFSINAFVGAWLLLANTAVFVVSARPIDRGAAPKSIGAFLIFASPILLWIGISSHAPDQEIKFSYIEYIRLYYPDHFLIEATEFKWLVVYALVAISGVISSQYMSQKNYWVKIQMALVFIFLIGIPLPYLINSRFVFNLHLLRSAGIEQAIAISLSTIAGVKLLLDVSKYQKRLLGATVLSSIAFLDIGIVGLAVIPFAILLGLYVDQDAGANSHSRFKRLIITHGDNLTWACFAIFLFSMFRRFIQHDIGISQLITFITIGFVLILTLWQNMPSKARATLLALIFVIYGAISVVRAILWHTNDAQQREAHVIARDNSWTELIDWIRQSDTHGIFLVPVKDERSNLFQLQARRPVWVDWKQGAAVMWSPSFHDQWAPRYLEVSGLVSPEDYILYARDHKIANVVLQTESGTCPSPSLLKRRTPHYVLCQVSH